MKDFIHKPVLSLSRQLSMIKKAMQHSAVMDHARKRIVMLGTVMMACYGLISYRLMDVMLFQSVDKPVVQQQVITHPRGDIYDCHHNLLATNLITASLYAVPKVVMNPEEAAQKLAAVFQDVSYETFLRRLSTQKGFVWLVRHVPPKLQQTVNELGIPGIYLQKDYKRVYPYGNLLSHLLGYCGAENNGLSGIEKYFDDFLTTAKEPLTLAVDMRIQHIVHDVLTKAMAEFKAVGGNAMVMHIKTGEILAMVSLPDFDPHRLIQTTSPQFFNRNTLGVNEPGSVWKILNMAIALETGHAHLNSAFDARTPIRLGRFTIKDFKAKNRVLNLTEAFVYSSNIAAVKIAQEFGLETQKNYFKKFGVFDTTAIEIPEIGNPLIPREWRESTFMTASYGYGLSVTPLQILSIVTTLINEGRIVKPTLLHRANPLIQRPQDLAAEPIISTKTSRMIREMMRMTALYGGSRKADVNGYEVFAKTGTAYKNKGKKGYNSDERNTSCIGGFPFSDPQYMIFVMLDSPKGIEKTSYYAAAGWNAAPTLGQIVERIAPMLAITPIEGASNMKYVRWYSDAPVLHTRLGGE